MGVGGRGQGAGEGTGCGSALEFDFHFAVEKGLGEEMGRGLVRGYEGHWVQGYCSVVVWQGRVEAGALPRVDEVQCLCWWWWW